MTRMNKNNFYDELCHLLTDYEQAEPSNDIFNWEENFYDMLVKIQNNWVELTGDDD